MRRPAVVAECIVDGIGLDINSLKHCRIPSHMIESVILLFVNNVTLTNSRNHHAFTTSKSAQLCRIPCRIPRSECSHKFRPTLQCIEVLRSEGTLNINPTPFFEAFPRQGTCGADTLSCGFSLIFSNKSKISTLNTQC